MSKDVLHVVPHDEGWGVKREGNERLSSTHGTQKEAIDSARTLAHDGDNIVIHRPDGTIREQVTYTQTPSTNGNAQTPLQPQDVVSVGSRVSWQAVLAGLAVTFTVYIFLTLLALAIGVSTMDYVRSRTFGIGAAVVGIVSLLAALFLGGYMTSRLSTRETRAEAVAYGVLLWAAFFFTLLLTGMNLGGSFGQMAQIARQPGAESRSADRPAQESSSTQEQTRRDEVRARGEQIMAEMNPVALAWWAFAGMALSVVAAIGGAVTGSGPGLEFRRVFGGQPEGRLATKPA